MWDEIEIEPVQRVLPHDPRRCVELPELRSTTIELETGRDAFNHRAFDRVVFGWVHVDFFMLENG